MAMKIIEVRFMAHCPFERTKGIVVFEDGVKAFYEEDHEKQPDGGPVGEICYTAPWCSPWAEKVLDPQSPWAKRMGQLGTIRWTDPSLTFSGMPGADPCRGLWMDVDDDDEWDEIYLYIADHRLP